VNDSQTKFGRLERVADIFRVQPDLVFSDFLQLLADFDLMPSYKMAPILSYLIIENLPV
jgi:hypothetical protein